VEVIMMSKQATKWTAEMEANESRREATKDYYASQWSAEDEDRIEAEYQRNWGPEADKA
jgi:hypothetical protein